MANEILKEMQESGMFITPEAVQAFAEPEPNPFTISSLAENPFDDVEMKTGGHQFEMPESPNVAALAAAMTMAKGSIYGAQQMFGVENPRYEAERQWVDAMEENYGTPVTIGKIAGQFLDPVSWYAPAAKAIKGAHKGITEFLTGTAKSGAKAGTLAGGLEYIPEGSQSLLTGGDATRFENAALGGAFGTALGPIIGGASKGVAKAYEPLGNIFWKTLGTPTGSGMAAGAYLGFEMEPTDQESRMRNALVWAAIGGTAFNSPKAVDALYGKFNPGKVASQSRFLEGGLPLTRPGQRWSDKGYTLQQGLGSWLVPNYGRSQQYVTALRKARSAEGLMFNEFDDVIQEIRNLPWKERKVLYRMMQGEDFGDIYDESFDLAKLTDLDQRSRTKIKELGRYLVDVGMLDSKVYAKNADNYLTTSYYKHEIAKFDDPLERIYAANLMFHRRGNIREVDADSFAAGKRPDSDKGEWEILDELDNGQVRIRRPWTKEEKLEMGEIEDSAYAMIQTARKMSKEGALGGFYKDLADAEGVVLQAGAPNGYLIPDRPEWGALRGKTVDKRVFQDLLSMRQIYQLGGGQKLWNYIQAATGTWKGLKTIASPLVHFNNLISSMHMYDLAGGNYSEVAAMAREIAKRGPLYKQMVEDGVFGTNFVQGELDEVGHILHETIGDKAIRMRANPNDGLRDAWDIVAKFTRGTAGKVWKGAGQVYAMEDNIWRAGLYKTKLDQALARGMDEKSARGLAADQAAKWFVDYDLGGTPVLNALRKTALPFFSYTYGTTPRLIEAAAKNPAAYAKWAGIYHVLNEMGQDHSGYSEEYFDQAIKMEEPSDKMFGVRSMPSAKIVMPAFIADKLYPNAPGPIALNMSRSLPLGTFNMQSTQDSPGGSDAGKVPFLPENLQPNFGLIGAIGGPMMNLNLGFGGKIREGEIGRTIMKNVLPNWGALPGTYAFEKSEKADALEQLGPGATNQFADDWSPTTATLSSLGPRFEVIDNPKMRKRLGMQFGKKISEKESQIRGIMRDSRYRLEVRQGGKGRLHQKIEELKKEIEKLKEDAKAKGL